MAGALLSGCAGRVEVQAPAPPQVYVSPPATVAVQAPAAVTVAAAAPGAFVITSADDFYQPLSAYGRWDDVPGVGRCWFPTQAAADWRPYTMGHWERTDAGWYWASDEPFGWATYHYGRWDCRADGTWYWAADVHWAPAWVSWRNGGGYAGWAPLPPAAKFEAGVGLHFDVNLIPARSYCFVSEQHFMEPIRSTTVIVNNTTIINKTVNITNVKVVNNTIINEGPSTQRIEQATGHPVQVAKVADLRRQSEARVAIKPKPLAAGERKEPLAAGERKTVDHSVKQPAKETRPTEKPALVTKDARPAEKQKTLVRQDQATKPKPAPEHTTEKVPANQKTEVAQTTVKHPPAEKVPGKDAAPPDKKAPDKKTPVKKTTPPKKEDAHPKPEKPEEDKNKKPSDEKKPDQ